MHKKENLRGFAETLLADLNWRGSNYCQVKILSFYCDHWLFPFFSSPLTGTGNTVVIMVGYPKGIEILEPVRRGIPVKMTIIVGTRHVQEYISGQSVVFVAIAFITMMIISLAWLIFYYIQRFLYTGSQFGSQVIWNDDALEYSLSSYVKSVAEVCLCIEAFLLLYCLWMLLSNVYRSYLQRANWHHKFG